MDQAQNEEQTEDFSLIGVTKAEAAEAYERIKRRVKDHHTRGERGQILHRYRMGLVVSSGALCGLAAGYTMPAWLVALAGAGATVAGVFFARSIGNLADE